MALAIFDLDETILDIDSDYTWTRFLYDKKIETSPEFYSKMGEFKKDYINGTLDIYKYVAFAVRPISSIELPQLREYQNIYLEERVKPYIRKKALELIQTHKKKGDFFLIITATNEVVTSVIAKHLKADFLLSTNLEFDGKHYLPKIKGTPCFREGKITRLKEWLKKNPEYDLKGSYFYSDSHNDLPLLQLVDNPYVVNADEKLNQYAKKNNWPILDLKN